MRQNKSESEVAAAVAKALEQQKALKAKGGPEQERAIADYRREDYHEFLMACRQCLRTRQRTGPPMDETS